MSQKNSFLNLDFSSIPCNDLADAIIQVMKDEKLELSLDVYNKDIQPVITSTTLRVTSFKDGLVDLFEYGKKAASEANSISEFTSIIIEDSKKKVEGAKEVAIEKATWVRERLPVVKVATINYLNQIQDDLSKCESSEEKIKYISMLVIYAGALGGGAYFGNELPDYDFKLWGGGAHRSFLSHSAAPGLVVWLSSAILVRTLERASLKIENDSSSHEVIEQLVTVIKMMSIGFGFGLTTHLIVDSVIDTGGTIRMHDFSGNSFGSFVTGTRVDDWAYTSLMSYFSEILSEDEFNKLKKPQSA